jgi:Zn finger protein HypA/HybF involved in hydrogenase expression
MRGRFMVRTIVCKKDGCSGNEFHIVTEDNRLKLICKDCGSTYYYDVSYYEFIMLSNCEKCNNDTFKVFNNLKSKNICKMYKCGSTAEKYWLMMKGVQVTYEQNYYKI